MKRLTLAMPLAMFVAMFVAAATTTLAAVGVVNAQVPVPVAPPAPSTPAPAPRARPAAPARPAIAPRACCWVDDVDMSDLSDRMRDLSFDATREVMMDTRINMEATRAALAATRDATREATREATRAMSLDITRDVMRDVPMAMDAAGTMMTGSLAPWGERSAVRMPPAAWAQGDPADSVYRVARDALIKGDYGRAATMFAEIQQKFPRSAYISNSQYYEAYARYKIGTTDELRAAAKILEPVAGKAAASTNAPRVATRGFYVGNQRGASDSEVATLYARINGVLAQRGDRDAAEKVAKAASSNGGAVCDNDDIDVRVEALNALSQMDPATALPLLKRVLDHKDECSAELRRRAVFMLGRRSDPEAAQLLIATAKSDPSMNVRLEAINALPRLPDDAGVSTLEDMLRTDQDERVQRAVVRVLAASDNPKVRASMRALIERKDAPLSLRIESIDRLNSDRATTDDAAYLRGLYGHADNDQIKEAIVGTVGRMGGADNDKWILSIAQNPNEPSQVRATAISRLMRSNISIADLSKLYDTSDSYNIRQQIVSALANRKEPEATDKLLDIVKNSTVVQVRAQAINALVKKNDPRGVKLLNDLLDGKAP